jgi:hypothetical protein
MKVFNNFGFRTAIRNALDSVDSNLQGINPHGIESAMLFPMMRCPSTTEDALLSDHNLSIMASHSAYLSQNGYGIYQPHELLQFGAYLLSRVPRKYVVVSTEQIDCDLNGLGRRIFDALYANLGYMQENIAIAFVNDVVIDLKPQDYVVKEDDVAIDIQSVHLNKGEDILDYLARYYLISLDGLLRNVGECHDYITNPMARRRRTQLFYANFLHLKKTLELTLTEDQESLFKVAKRNAGFPVQWMLDVNNGTTNTVYENAKQITNEELRIDNQLIKPLVLIMLERIKGNSSDLLTLSDYNLYRLRVPMTVQVDKTIWHQVKEVVRMNYEAMNIHA